MLSEVILCLLEFDDFALGIDDPFDKLFIFVLNLQTSKLLKTQMLMYDSFLFGEANVRHLLEL